MKINLFVVTFILSWSSGEVYSKDRGSIDCLAHSFTC